LVQNLLFDLAKKLNLTNCFKCGLEITSTKELSIEHKIPWFDNKIDLFWDLNNLAFSHRKCNRSERKRKKRIISPEGSKWCYKCKTHKTKESFNKNKSKPDGFEWECRECKYERNKEYKRRLNL
jgi:hypothetical protein